MCWDFEREKGEHPLGDVSGELLYSGVRVALQPANNKGRTLSPEKDPKGTCLYIFGLMIVMQTHGSLTAMNPVRQPHQKHVQIFTRKDLRGVPEHHPESLRTKPRAIPPRCLLSVHHFCTCPNHPPMLDPTHPKTVHLWNTGRAAAAYKQQHHVTIIFWVPVGP